MDAHCQSSETADWISVQSTQNGIGMDISFTLARSATITCVFVREFYIKSNNMKLLLLPEVLVGVRRSGTARSAGHPCLRNAGV